MADFSALFAAKAKAKTSGPGDGQTPAREEPPQMATKKRKKKRKHEQQPGPSSAKPHASAPAPIPSGSMEDKRARKMSAQLSGAQFRYINEQLYTRPSDEAVQLFKEEPNLYEAYHVGFRLQAARWPLRPVQAIAQWLLEQPKNIVVADLGCGDAELAATVRQRVHSFDLVAHNDRVVACDIANVPLPDASVHVAVFCLALMGSNFATFLREAHRLLKPNGTLKIAEVSSRIEDADGWGALMHALGFDRRTFDDSNSHFVMYDFVKSGRAPEATLPTLRLKPCVYKKR